MFNYDQYSLDRMALDTGGQLEATFSDVYQAQRKADTLGAQSWSETSGMATLMQEELSKVKAYRGFDDTGVDSVDRALADLYQQGQEQATARPEGTTEQLYEKLISDLKLENPEVPFKDLETIRDEVAQKARQAFDEAQDVSSRADETNQFLGGMASGAVTGLKEPLNVAAMVATAPLAMETLAGGLVLKLAQVAAIEGTVSGGSEYAIQESIRDYYVRQGFTEEQVDQRIRDNVIGAAAGGAVLAPTFGLAGLGVGKLLSKWLGKMDSANPVELRETLEEMRNHPSTSDADVEAINQVMLALRQQETMPESIKTPSDVRSITEAADSIRTALDGGQPLRPGTRLLDENGYPRVFETEKKAKRFSSNESNDIPTGTKIVQNEDGSFGLEYNSNVRIEADGDAPKIFTSKKAVDKAALEIEGETRVIELAGEGRRRRYLLASGDNAADLDNIAAELRGMTDEYVQPSMLKNATQDASKSLDEPVDTSPRIEGLDPEIEKLAREYEAAKQAVTDAKTSGNPSTEQALNESKAKETLISKMREKGFIEDNTIENSPTQGRLQRSQLEQDILSGKYDDTINAEVSDFLKTFDALDADPELKAEVKNLINEADEDVTQLQAVIACMRG